MKYTTIVLALLPALGFAQDAYGPHCNGAESSRCNRGWCVRPNAGSFKWSNGPVCVFQCNKADCAQACSSQSFDKRYQTGYCYATGGNNFCVCTDNSF
ncbi:hypothetical protein DIS24_g10350 [Lasiodiplodia hormozganensis]|uniref:Uncharacterized protein n=1 Tax=Lasiodiplodia hormozganensis TaxID=869390 RepID=A0AA40CHM4_9PEZI|nr:hypothetical protein DIS24_g10350 [Lasiodiplodia hormozganensis]